jgi:molybdopterin/thiamine biosynthesis adenylyltransferase/proteasome lid subunit RPN8/RPN11
MDDGDRGRAAQGGGVTGVVLVLSEEHAAQLDGMAQGEPEDAAVLLCGIADLDGGLRLLVREIHRVPDEHIRLRTATELAIGSAGYVPALGRAEQLDAVPVFLHSHPPGVPGPSSSDARVDRQLRPVATVRSGQDRYASLVLSGGGAPLSFTGRLHDGRRWRPISRMWIVGDRLRAVWADDVPTMAPPAEIFDRQVRAFGPDIQRLLGELTIGVVGGGGTGSPTAEMLTRLGVGRLVLVDDDLVDDKNVTRIHESRLRDVGSPKIEMLKRRLVGIGLGTRIDTVKGRITDPDVAMELRKCDVIFGCTDDQGGRGVLSRFAYWYLTPVFDMGFVIDADPDARAIQGLIGRITTIVPGTACLFCRKRIDPAVIAAEAMSPEERRQRAGEGYAPAIADSAPAVVAYTTMVASIAVSELIERLVGYTDSRPSELLVLLHERALSRNSIPPRSGHFCSDHANWGRGDGEPTLGRTW